MTVETINQISASERIRRHREVDFARGNVRHEGGILSEEIERLNANYIAGEIDSGELTAAILRSQTVQLSNDDPTSRDQLFRSHRDARL